MKKFIVLMIALFIGLVANAQIVPVYDKDGSLLKHEFHLGEYVFKTSFADGLLLHQRFSVETNTEEEKKTLYDFIRKNENAIEQKYGIEIERCVVLGPLVQITLSTKYALNVQQNALEEEARKKETETNKRINSLNDIL